MKKLLLLTGACVLALGARAQNVESASPDNIPTGLYMQQGPGSPNTQGWTYPYGTKIIANAGPNRNFEMLIDTYPDGKLFYRQWKPAASSWHSWMKIVSENESGNVGIGTGSPTDRLNVEVATNKRIGINVVSSSAISDFVNGAAAIHFSRPDDGTNALHGIFSYNSSIGDNNFALSARGDMVFAAGGSGTYTVSPEVMRIHRNGSLLIGKISPTNNSYKLDVNGKVRANEIVVNTTGADFVFAKDYKLRSLADVKAYIDANGHLPEVPSAKTMQEEGVGISELQTKLAEDRGIDTLPD